MSFPKDDRRHPPLSVSFTSTVKGHTRPASISKSELEGGGKSLERLDIFTIGHSRLRSQTRYIYCLHSHRMGLRNGIEALCREKNNRYVLAARFKLARVFPTGNQVSKIPKSSALDHSAMLPITDQRRLVYITPKRYTNKLRNTRLSLCV